MEGKTRKMYGGEPSIATSHFFTFTSFLPPVGNKSGAGQRAGNSTTVNAGTSEQKWKQFRLTMGIPDMIFFLGAGERGWEDLSLGQLHLSSSAEVING